VRCPCACAWDGASPCALEGALGCGLGGMEDMGERWVREKSGIEDMPSTSSSSALYRTYGVLGSSIFMNVSPDRSVSAMFASSHVKCAPEKLDGMVVSGGSAFLRMPFGFGADPVGGGE